MADRIFTTLPTRAISDSELTGLDLRVLACVSLHDGMSLLKGKGAGCYVSNANLAALVGCDYTSLSKSLSRLRDRGYLVQERQADDKRMITFRVPFPACNGWRDGQLSRAAQTPAKSAAPRPDTTELVGEDANGFGEIVGRENPESRQNLPKTASQYIPLKGELDSVETEEIDSPEGARLTTRGLGEGERVPSIGEQLARFERAFKQQPEGLNLVEWVRWLEWAEEVSLGESDTDAGRARRLIEEVCEALSDEQFAEWQADEPRVALPVESVAAIRELEAEPANGFGQAIRQQVGDHWKGLEPAGRTAFAKSVGLTVAELHDYTRGFFDPSIQKQAALRSAVKLAAPREAA